MQKATKNNEGRRLRGDRSGSRPPADSARQNGAKQRKSHDRPIKRSGFPFLAAQLRSCSAFELYMHQGHLTMDEVLKIVDTEAKQLQAIQDLYAIVKAQPRYANLKEPDFPSITEPVVVITWLLRKLGPLAQGNQWTVDTYKDGKKIRYRFIVKQYYNSQMVRHEEFYIPLHFLPGLIKRDRALHDLIIDTVALVSKHNKIPLWDEDGDLSVVLADVKKRFSKNEARAEVQRQVLPGADAMWQSFKLHTTGPAGIYLKLIKERRKIVTYDSLRQAMRSFAVGKTSGRQDDIVWWIKRGLTIVEMGETIHQHTCIPNFYGENPVSPYRRNKFVWTMNDDDYVAWRAKDQIDLDGQKQGVFSPTAFSVTHPGEIVQPVKWDIYYPRAMSDFMQQGYSIFATRYNDYFYNSKRAKKLLIEIFNPITVEAGDLQQQLEVRV